MVASNYPAELPMQEARLLYFRDNGFGDDGGYHKKVEWVKIGPLTLPVLNPPARVYALRFHDMHHVLTGYATDWRGEFEIAAWELAAGCYTAWVAWLLNLGSFAAGILFNRRRTVEAFRRGCYTQSLYRHGARDLEHESVAALRSFTHLDQPPGPWRGRDIRLFAAMATLAFVWGTIQVAVALAPIVGLAYLLWWALA